MNSKEIKIREFFTLLAKLGVIGGPGDLSQIMGISIFKLGLLFSSFSDTYTLRYNNTEHPERELTNKNNKELS